MHALAVKGRALREAPGQDTWYHARADVLSSLYHGATLRAIPNSKNKKTVLLRRSHVASDTYLRLFGGFAFPCCQLWAERVGTGSRVACFGPKSAATCTSRGFRHLFVSGGGADGWAEACEQALIWSGD